MSEASPRPSPEALPSRVCVAWGADVLEVRHLTPGTRWAVSDVVVEATRTGTRVLAGDDEVLLAAGAGEAVSRTFGGLTLSLSPALPVERVRHDPGALDVRFFKITAIALLTFFALVAAFVLTPLEGLSDGDVFSGPPVRLTVSMPPEKTVARLPKFERPAPTVTQPAPLLAPRTPVDRTQKAANDLQRVQNLMAGLFGNHVSRLLGAGSNQAIDQGLNALRAPGEGASADGLGGMGARSTGPGGPAGSGLHIGGFGGRPSGVPGGFGLNPGGKKPVGPGEGPQRVIVTDGLPRDVVMAVIRRHQSEIKFCYERELQQHGGLSGKVAVTWTIDATGSIADAQIAESGLDNANVEACMLERIRRWKFPEPAGGGVAVITFPWVFHAAGVAE